MTSSNNTLSLTTTVDAKEWNEYVVQDYHCDGKEVILSGLQPLIPFSSYGDIVTPENTATLMLYSIFASVCSETDVTQTQPDIFTEYMNILCQRLDNGEDTGLAHRDVLPMWISLSSQDKKKIVEQLRHACHALENFPDISRMNIVDAFISAYIDSDIADIPVMIPATVATSRGVAGVIPSLTPMNDAHSSLTHIGYPLSTHITQWHLWDISNNKVSSIRPSLWEKHTDALVR